MPLLKPPLRTLFLSSCARGGGAGWSLYYLLKHLDRGKIEPLVVMPSCGIFERRFQELGVRMEILPRLHDRTNQPRFGRDNWLSATASYALNAIDSGLLVFDLVKLIRRERIGLVYCNNMMVKAIGALAAQRAGVPCVLHVRNVHERAERVLFYGSVARLPAVRRVIANSAASAASYRRYVPQKVTVVHNGVDLDEYAGVERGAFRRELGIGRDVTIVGFTGNLIPHKGVMQLIRAAARLLPVRSGVVFVVLGRVPVGSRDHLAECEALTRELGVAGRFRFIGFREDVRPAVADFDVLVLPSLRESFGRSIVEAMALGTPVVASRVGGIPEILTHEQDGLLVEPGDVNGLAASIGRLVDDPQRRAALANRALERVRQSFDVARLTGRIQQLLLEAADQKTSRLAHGQRAERLRTL